MKDIEKSYEDRLKDAEAKMKEMMDKDAKDKEQKE